MRALLVLPLVLGLTGCNWLSHVTGLSKGSDQAVGAACRQTGRSLEECYQLNPDCDKGQMFAGWRDMQDYMVKEKLPTMSPPPPPQPPAPVVAPVASPGAQNTSNNNQGGAAPVGSGAQANAPDPEVQAVLDTINNRSDGANTAAQPTSAEQQQLKQMLDKMSGNQLSSSSGKKKTNN